MKNKVSVIVPIYQVADYLERGLDSLLEQTYKNLEIILVDDGSLDHSGKICDNYALKDERIIVVHKSNGGVSSARNIGIKKATGEYIYFLDPDDYLEKTIIEELVKGISKENCDLSICNYYIDKNSTRSVKMNLKSKIYDKKDILHKILQKDFFGGYVWNKLFKKDIIQLNNLSFDEEIPLLEDLLFSCQYITYCKSVFYTNAPLYNYFMRDHSAINEKNFNSQKLRVYKALEQLMILYNKISPENIVFLKEKYLKITFNYVYLLKINKDSTGILQEQLKQSKTYKKELLRENIPIKKKIEIIFTSTFPYLYGCLREYFKRE